MQPANKLGSFKVSAKHAVSSKDLEEKSPQTSHQASCSSGRSPGKRFCPLSVSLIAWCLWPRRSPLLPRSQLEAPYRCDRRQEQAVHALSTALAKHLLHEIRQQERCPERKKAAPAPTPASLANTRRIPALSSVRRATGGAQLEARERHGKTRRPSLCGTNAHAVHILRACGSNSCTQAALHYTIFLCQQMIPLKSGLLLGSLRPCSFPPSLTPSCFSARAETYLPLK